MTGRIVLAAVLAAVAMFVWGFVYWGLIGVPVQLDVMAPFPGDQDGSAGTKLRELVGEAGETSVYVYPWPPSMADDEAAIAAFTARHRAGPRVQLFYQKEGAEPMGPPVFAQGWFHYFILALLTGIVLAMALPAMPTFGQRFLFVAMVGVIGSIWTTLGAAIWFQHPWGYATADALYGIVAGLLMAAVLAAIIRPKSNLT